MSEKSIDKTLGKILAIGTAAITIFLLSGVNTDPVNVTKLFTLGVVSVSAGCVVLVFKFKNLIQENKISMFMAFLFVIALINSTINSGAPLVQSFYGTYGRNTGTLTYLFLVVIFISASSLRSYISIEYVTFAMFFAGFLNVIYCGWALTFGDFVGWNNPYGNILGTFGNPNFISAFLGMFITGSIAYSLKDSLDIKKRIFSIILSFLAFIEILKSHAIQGIVVTFGGLAIVIFFKIRSKFESKTLSFSYLTIFLILGILAILGALQHGPFSFVYKRSVSLRGTYWKSGINMANEKPWTGVGMDAYGDWYRRMRPPIALIDTPGISTLSNAAHNVPLDIFAFGGWPLAIAYAGILFLGILAILKISKKQKKFDSVFVGIASIWICYQVQALISINQIGLAVWGWLLTGLLIAYQKLIINENSINLPRRKNLNQTVNSLSVISAGLVAGIGGLVGALLSVPPLNADMKWFNAINSRNAQVVEAALKSSYMNPPNSFKYAQAVQLFQASNLLDSAHKYAMEAVKFNSDYFDAWKQIYYLPNSSENEKALALENLKRLDPKNPDPTKNYD